MLVLKGDVKYKYSFQTDFNSPPPTYLHHNFAFLSNAQHFLPKDFEPCIVASLQSFHKLKILFS